MELRRPAEGESRRSAAARPGFAVNPEALRTRRDLRDDFPMVLLDLEGTQPPRVFAMPGSTGLIADGNSNGIFVDCASCDAWSPEAFMRCKHRPSLAAAAALVEAVL